MKKPLILILILIVAAGLFWAGHFYWQNLRGAGAWSEQLLRTELRRDARSEADSNWHSFCRRWGHSRPGRGSEVLRQTNQNSNLSRR
jgi:hypothetical protein